MVDIILVLHCLPVTLSAVQQIHFSFLSILPVFVFDLDVVIGFCTTFGNIVCFGATMVQDVLFPLAGDTSVNDGGLSFLLNMFWIYWIYWRSCIFVRRYLGCLVLCFGYLVGSLPILGG